MDAGNKSKQISTNKENVILSILSARTISEGCKNAGINRSTFYKWMNDTEFRNQLLSQSKQFLDAARMRLIRQADLASATLADLLKANNDNVRLRASNLILEHAVRFVELENIAQRVELLEQKVNKKKRFP